MAAGSGAAIADLYGQLATYDLRRLEGISSDLGSRRRRRPTLRRRGRCPACSFRAGAVARKAHFLAEALAEEDAREAYSRSDGLCFPHFARALESALAAENAATATFLLDDWRDRLVHLGAELSDYDRRRDYRYVSEPKGVEQQSWTEIIRLYVGGDA